MAARYGIDESVFDWRQGLVCSVAGQVEMVLSGS
jgi:hypothetical protein